MRIEPITPTYKPVIHTRRAIMAIERDKHTVVTDTGERIPLDAMEAWKLYEMMNNGELYA